jgi:hypothetical protein
MKMVQIGMKDLNKNNFFKNKNNFMLINYLKKIVYNFVYITNLKILIIKKNVRI